MKIEEFVRIVQLSVQWYYTKHPIVQILVKSKQNQNQSQLRFVKIICYTINLKKYPTFQGMIFIIT